MNFILGVIFGIIVATVGFTGIAKMLDSGVNQTKSVVQKIEVDKN
jgi:hypothetical protein